MFAFLKRRPARPLRAHFERQGLTIEVGPDQTLLQAALAAGLPFPHNCRVGSCTTCKCRLRGGRVRQLTDTSYVLKSAERKAGAILACQARLLEDVRIDVAWPESQWPGVPVDGTIASVRPLTGDIVELTIELRDPITYTAGQYAKIGLPSLGIWRDYSFAGAPEPEPQKSVCFYVRQTPDGHFSRWLDAGRVNEPVQVLGPMGHFVLSASNDALLCVAGGTGLAPIKAMLEQAARQGCQRDTLLLFGARTRDDLYAMDALGRVEASWAGRFRFVPVLSEEPAASGWTGAVGMVTDQLAAQIAGLGPFEAYLCGPPQMVDTAVAALRAGGVPEDVIFTDRFVSSSEATEPPVPAVAT